MVRFCQVAGLVLIGWAGLAFAQEPCGTGCGTCGGGPCGGGCWGLLRRHCASYCGISCYHPPPPEPCICEDPCCKGHHWCWPWQAATTARLLDQLEDCHYRCRAQAAHGLGCRLHADFCCNPEIVSALVHALQCDPCWVVRRQAAWAIAYQGVANQCGWTALFLASRLDPHYLVRDAAANALSVLETQISLGCIKEWRTMGEEFEKLVKSKYKPGKEDCYSVYPPFCECYGMTVVVTEAPKPPPAAQ